MATISHRVTVRAPQARVFQALTTIEGLKSWYAPTIDGSVEKNQEAVFKFTDYKEPFRWRFIDVRPHTLARWQCIEGPGAAAGTTVTFTISDKATDHTIVECDHEGWPEGHDAFKTCNTLWGILMGHLRDYVETGQARPAFR